MLDIYHRVAETFAQRINEVFFNEESLEAEFRKSFEHLEFSRTDHSSTLLGKLFRECWYASGPEVKAEPTGYDRLATLRCLYNLIDYNLFTQVLLNLQTYNGMAYMTKDAEAEIEKLKEGWPKDAKTNPFEPKAKLVKNASTDEEQLHNSILRTIKSLKIISQFTPQVSFRVSPMGSTPAFADSRNISMIGIGGDRFLRTLPNLKPFYIHWEPGSNPTMALSVAYINDSSHQAPLPPNPKGLEFEAPGIPYHFFSKSGGEILQEVLFARKIMAELFAAHDITSEMCIMIPRMNSVLIVTDQYGLHLKRAFENLKKTYPVLELAEGVR